MEMNVSIYSGLHMKVLCINIHFGQHFTVAKDLIVIISIQKATFSLIQGVILSLLKPSSNSTKSYDR